MSRVSGNPGIPGKKVQFSVFRTTQEYSLFLENREKISGKIGRFRKISENQNPENSEIRKISEKNAKRRFWKIQPSFAERVLKRTF
jgi:hypothetical protein